MEYTCEGFSFSEKKFSICDAQIDAIICGDSFIRFVFSKGFFIINESGSKLASLGYIELNNCNADEISCHIIRRVSTPRGAQLHGNPISLTELSKIIADEKRKIEIFLELYDFNYLYWRGVLLPHKMQGLSDNVVIETCGIFPITYFWN